MLSGYPHALRENSIICAMIKLDGILSQQMNWSTMGYQLDTLNRLRVTHPIPLSASLDVDAALLGFGINPRGDFSLNFYQLLDATPIDGTPKIHFRPQWKPQMEL